MFGTFHVGRAVARGLAGFSAALCLAVSAAAAAQGQQIQTFPMKTQYATPRAIAPGPDGGLWFTVAGAEVVGRMAPDGTEREFPTIADLARPTGIAGGSDGAMWFVQEVANTIGRIDPAGRITEFALVDETGVPTPDAGLRDIALGPDGAMWFTERNANQIGRIETDGSITEFPLLPFSSAPEHITAGPDGALYFTTERQFPQTPSVGRITTAGAVEEVASIERAGNGIVLGPDGGIWVTAERPTPAGILIRVDPVTRAVATYPIPGTEFTAGITAGPDGAVWLTGQTTLHRATATNPPVFTQFTAPYPSGVQQPRPNDIALGNDGAMWFLEPSNGTVGRIPTVAAPQVVLAPASGGPCSGIDASGKNFGAYEPVQILLAGEGLGPGRPDALLRTDARGSYGGAGPMVPPKTAGGGLTVRATGLISGLQAERTFQVSGAGNCAGVDQDATSGQEPAGLVDVAPPVAQTAPGTDVSVSRVTDPTEFGGGIAYNPRRPTHVVAVGLKDLSLPTSDATQCVIWTSTDGGRSWSQAELLPLFPAPGMHFSQERCSSPTVTALPDGSAFLVAYRSVDKANIARTTREDQLVSYRLAGDFSGGEAVRVGDRTKGHLHAQPGLGVHRFPTKRRALDEVYLAYSHHAPGDAFPGTCDVDVVRSSDGGLTWSAPETLAEAPSCGSDGGTDPFLTGATVAGGRGGNMLACWWSSGDDGFAADSGGGGKFDIECRGSRDFGATFAPPSNAPPSKAVAGETNELPRHLCPNDMHEIFSGSWPSLAVANDGSAHIVYAHDPPASTEETECGDVRYVRSHAGTPPYALWEPPVSIVPTAAGRAAQTFPVITATRNPQGGNCALAVAYLTHANFPLNNLRYDVAGLRSRFVAGSCGATGFGDQIPVSDAESWSHHSIVGDANASAIGGLFIDGPVLGTSGRVLWPDRTKQFDETEGRHDLSTDVAGP